MASSVRPVGTPSQGRRSSSVVTGARAYGPAGGGPLGGVCRYHAGRRWRRPGFPLRFAARYGLAVIHVPCCDIVAISHLSNPVLERPVSVTPSNRPAQETAAASDPLARAVATDCARRRWCEATAIPAAVPPWACPPSVSSAAAGRSLLRAPTQRTSFARSSVISGQRPSRRAERALRHRRNPRTGCGRASVAVSASVFMHRA
jgi:hypothetical protein